MKHFGAALLKHDQLKFFAVGVSRVISTQRCSQIYKQACDQVRSSILTCFHWVRSYYSDPWIAQRARAMEGRGNLRGSRASARESHRWLREKTACAARSAWPKNDGKF